MCTNLYMHLGPIYLHVYSPAHVCAWVLVVGVPHSGASDARLDENCPHTYVLYVPILLGTHSASESK